MSFLVFSVICSLIIDQIQLWDKSMTYGWNGFKNEDNIDPGLEQMAPSFFFLDCSAKITDSLKAFERNTKLLLLPVENRYL